MTGSSSQQQAEKRRRSRFRILCAAAAVLAALTVTAAIMGKSFTHKPAPAQAQPSAAPSAPAQAPSASGQAQPASPFPTDDRGFVNSAARCDDTQTAMAVGRTQRSLVVICVNPHGNYEYRGVRISDGTPLTVPAETTSGGGFVAENEGVSYAVSSTQLLVTSGDTVINREPMIEYQQPHSYATATGAPPTTPAPAR